MQSRSVETAIALWGDRHLPTSMVADQARALAASGVVDGILIADQLVNFIPRQLWTPEITPMANVLKDPDSHSDAFALGEYLAAVAPQLHISLSTDSVRRGPSELIQCMLTLANMTQGRLCVQIGGGEVKQTKPYGYKRSHGVSRMADLFKVYRAMVEAEGEPIDYEGKYWTFEKATLGSAMIHKPEIWGLGGGPRLLDNVTRYADGIGVTCPPVYGTPEAFAAARAEILDMVKSQGRDPGRFRIGIWFAVLLVDNPRQLEIALQNRLVKWFAGVMGRVIPGDWAAVGLESPVPLDWNYFQHFLPYETSDGFIKSVIARTTPEHARKGWLVGTPAEVADMIQPYIEAGADWVCPMDYLPLVLEPAEAETAFGRSIELCKLIKQRQSD